MVSAVAAGANAGRSAANPKQPARQEATATTMPTIPKIAPRDVVFAFAAGAQRSATMIKSARQTPNFPPKRLTDLWDYLESWKIARCNKPAEEEVRCCRPRNRPKDDNNSVPSMGRLGCEANTEYQTRYGIQSHDNTDQKPFAARSDDHCRWRLHKFSVVTAIPEHTVLSAHDIGKCG